MTPLLWGFEEREKLMEFYERFQAHACTLLIFVLGGVHRDLPDGLISDKQVL